MRATSASRLLLLVSLACACAYAKDPAPARATGIDVGGEIVRHQHLTPGDLAKLPHTKVHASAHGVEGDFDGVPLIEILRAGGAPTGETLRGPALALYVRITAADGYRVVFALAELDPGTGNRTAILADRKNGQPLDHKGRPAACDRARRQAAGAMGAAGRCDRSAARA
jgi:hypothetical protein